MQLDSFVDSQLFVQVHVNREGSKYSLPGLACLLLQTEAGQIESGDAGKDQQADLVVY